MGAAADQAGLTHLRTKISLYVGGDGSLQSYPNTIC